MADIESNIDINIDTTDALANLKRLQAQISSFHQSMSKGGAATNAQLAQLRQNLVNGINATGKFSATIQKVATTTETFTTALEKNKLSMGQYFRYAGSQVTGFRKVFSSEFDTIEKVARERVKTLQTQYIKLGRDANGAMQSIAVRPLKLDMQDLGTQTAIAAQKQQIFNQLIKQGSTNLLNFGKNTQWAGRQLMVGFTIPLSIFGTTAAREFMKIEEQVIRFQRVYGDLGTSTEATKEMTVAVKELASEFTKYGVSVEKTMGVAADAAAMGKQGADLLAQVTETTRLAVLGGVDQQTALETTTSLTNAFGISTEKLAGKINFLNSVENQTVTSIEDLTEAIPKAGPVVQQLGGNVEDLAFFLTAMKEGGINASEGANALKSGLASIINPTQEARDMLGGFGINLQGIVDANKGDVKGIVIGFAQALDKLDPLNRAQAIEQLFGKFQFARMSTLFQNVIAEGSQASKVLELSRATAEELAVLSERELAKVENTTTYKFKKAWEDMKASLAPVGEAFLKAVTPLIEFGTKILDKFNEMSDGSKQFVTILVGAVAGIGPIFLMTFGLIANGIANIIKGFAAVNGFLQRTGNQSTILGNETEYMTQQQLEAAAVAASLNQVHSNLIQTFTSEASAVAALANQYERAVAAQSRMRGPIVPGGKGKAPKKYAKGVTMVPGTGNGDTQPAMLTPGEAVIPKDMVKKYAPLIAGMVSGNIPGFAGGMIPMFAEYALRLQDKKENMSQGAGTVGNVDQILSFMASRIGEARGITPTQANVNAGKFDSIAKEYEAITEKFRKKLNEEFETTFKQIEDTNERFAAAWNSAGRSVEKEVNAIASDVDRGVVRKTFGLDEDFYGTIPTEPRRAGQTEPTRARKGAFLKSQTGVGSYLPVGAAAKTLYERRTGQSAADFQMGHVNKPKQVDIQDLLADPRRSGAVKTAAKTMAIEVTEAVVQGVNEAAASQSPSRKAKAAGKNIADGAIIGIEGGVDDAKVAGQMIGQSATTGVAQGGGVAGVTGGGTGKQKSKLGKFMGRAGGVGLVASGALSAATMIPGQVGEVASQLAGPAMMASTVASMLPAILPLISNPVGAAVAAVVAVLAALGVAVGVAVNNFNTARDAALGLAKQLGASQDSLKKFGEFAGTVSSGEIRDKQRAAAINAGALAPGQETFGASYLETDAGKALAKGFTEALNTQGAAAAQGMFSTQLANAISSGVLTVDQAKSIAYNLGAELGSMDLGIKVNGELTDLFGPNGENLAKQPLELRLKVAQKSQEDLKRTLASNLDVISQLNPANMMTAVLGTGNIVGTVGQVMTIFDYFGKLGEAGGEIAGSMQNMLAVSQEQIDALELDYQKRIEIARAAGDTLKVAQLESKLIEGRTALLQQQAQATQQIQQAYRAADPMLQQAISSGAIKSVEDAYKGTKQESAANTAKDAILNAPISNEKELVLLVRLANQDMQPEQITSLMKSFTDPEALNKAVNLMLKVDPGTAGQASYIMDLLKGEEVKTQFLMNLETDINGKKRSAGEIQEYVNTFAEIGQLQTVTDISAILSFYVKNPEKLEQIKADRKELDALGDVSITAYANAIGAPELLQMTEYAKAFDSLPNETRKDFISYYETIYTTRGTPEFQKNLEAQNKAGFKGGKGTAADLAAALAAKQTNIINAQKNAAAMAKYEQDVAAYESTGGGGGGGGSAGEVQKVNTLDNLLKKIRDVRAATTAMTKGWNESRTALDNLFGNGIVGFNGLQQQMRKLNAGEDLITLIAGMDPDEYERRKNELFVFDAAGNIVQARQSLLSLAEAMRAIAMGDFQDKQQKTINTIRDQQVAVQKLVAAGLSYADAYEAVQDAAYASAVANEKNNEVIRQSIKDANAAAVAQRNLAAAQNLANSTQSTEDQQKLYEFLTKNADKLTDAQTQAILGNKDLQTLALSPNFDPNTFQNALDNVAKQTEVDLKLKKLTIKGMEEVFDEGFSKAMEAFSAQEKQINIKFKVLKDPLNDIIREAQQNISDIQNAPGGLDDLDADLQRISDQEVDINKKYDKRLKALDSIAKINDRFTKQQKAQLTIADALTQGDIAAAARAAQDMRAQQAADVAQDQRAALEKARETELANLTSTMGLTREQIEQRVRDLKREILDIEENTLEPAQYRLELLDRQEQSEIRSLTVLGKTKDKWEEIKNSIDVAKTSSDTYTKAIEDARDVVSDILKYWDDIDGKEVAVDVVVRQTEAPTVATPTAAPAIAPAAEAVTGGGGGGGGAAAPVMPTEIPMLETGLADVENMETDFWSGLSTGWNDFWSGIGSSIGTLWDTYVAQPIAAAWQLVLDNFVTPIQNIFIYFSGVIGQLWNDYVVKPISDFFAMIGAWIDTNIGQPFNKAMTDLGIWWDTYVTQPVNQFFTNVAVWWDTNIAQPFNKGMMAIQEWWNTYVTKPINDGIAAVQGWWNTYVMTPINNGINAIKTGWNNFFSTLASLWEAAKKSPEAFGQKLQEVIGNIRGWFQGVFDSIGNFFRDLPGKVAAGFSSIASNIGSTLKGAVNGMFDLMRGVSILGWKPFSGLPRLAKGGQIPGTGNKDTYPAMLMPGEFVIRKDMVQKYGPGLFESINAGKFQLPSFDMKPDTKDIKTGKTQMAGSVYNNTYSINVNVKSDAQADDIARAVMMQIKNVDAQRIRGNRF